MMENNNSAVKNSKMTDNLVSLQWLKFPIVLFATDRWMADASLCSTVIAQKVSFDYRGQGLIITRNGKQENESN